MVDPRKPVVKHSPTSTGLEVGSKEGLGELRNQRSVVQWLNTASLTITNPERYGNPASNFNERGNASGMKGCLSPWPVRCDATSDPHSE